MKLIFNKDQNNEITVQLKIGTVAEDFSYTKMVKQLLKNNVFEETDYTNISEEEKIRIEAMLKKINDAIVTDNLS
jgi:translation initiation factor 2 gamma subunit (eIF-2gamma)